MKINPVGESKPASIGAADLGGLIARQPRTTVIIDVREEEDFAQEHIKGAVNIPSSRFKDDNDVDEVISSIPHGTAVIAVHCQQSQVRGPKCAARLSERLQISSWEGLEAKPQIKVLQQGFKGFYKQFGTTAHSLIETDSNT